MSKLDELLAELDKEIIDYEAVTLTPREYDLLRSALREREEMIVGLWNLLDDIDTLDDACKSNDADFRTRCYEKQRLRFGIVSGEQIDRILYAAGRK